MPKSPLSLTELVVRIFRSVPASQLLEACNLAAGVDGAIDRLSLP